MAHLKKEQETTAIGAKEKTRRAKKEKLAGFVFQTQSHSWQHLNLSLPKEGGKRRDMRREEKVEVSARKGKLFSA